MSVDYRHIVKQMYPGTRWEKQVDRMTDAKVFAIYKSHQDKLENGKRDKR